MYIINHPPSIDLNKQPKNCSCEMIYVVDSNRPIQPESSCYQ
ncbi:hypothetical protein EV13_2935 [Prochlorococcus sp. MIT 0702]|nr:hypothetical protein EV13_2935 [Prochlorococcus sp. MIT 0702]